MERLDRDSERWNWEYHALYDFTLDFKTHWRVCGRERTDHVCAIIIRVSIF